MKTNASSSNIIAELCHNEFDSLPISGKPKTAIEWTVLAGIVLEKNTNHLLHPSNFCVVALGTGTKCLGPSKFSYDGKVLRDCHAEVLAKRGFLKFLYAELQFVLDKKESTIFRLNSGKVELLPNAKFHFYISQTPCGDASIIPMKNIKKRKANEEIIGNSKLRKLDVQDGTRTGGKPVPGETPDPKTKDNYHNSTDTLRNKPGRGEFTQCMSCSDKIMKWNAIGCQGALLSYFIRDPIRFASIVIGQSVFDFETIDKAINGRVIKSGLINSAQAIPILNSNLEFKFSQNKILEICDEPKPCGSAISWAKTETNEMEITAANGYTLGMTRKHLQKSNKVSSICSKGFLQSFKSLVKFSTERNLAMCTCKDLSNLETLSYRALKDMSPYSLNSKKFKSVFKNWFLHNYKLDEYT